MAYTNVWDDTKPTGAEAANTIDDIFRSVKVDIEQRFIDIFAMPNFTDDPLRPYGLKFTDAQDAEIFLGDNAGTPRSLLIRDKADSITLHSFGATSASLSQGTTTSTLSVGSGTGSGVSQIVIRGAAGQTRQLLLSTGASGTRWSISASTTAESGSDAGSNFNLNAFTDAGALIDTPISVNRAAGGTLTLARPTTVSATLFTVSSSTTAGINVGNGTGSGASTINIKVAAGQQGSLSFQTSALSRWVIGKSNTAESGANAGSNFFITAVDDAGVSIDIPISIVRAATGAITIVRPITHTDTLASFVQSTTSASFNVGSGTGSSTSRILIRGAAGQTRDIHFTSGASSTRWQIQTSATAESGSDAGSNFAIGAYTDVGVFIDNPISITRAAAGAISIVRPTSIAHTLTVNVSSGNAFTVGRQGATNPAFHVATSTASSATGIKVTAAAAAGGVAIAAISSGGNENLTIDAKGSGTITIGSVSTGNIIFSRDIALTATKKFYLDNGVDTYIVEDSADSITVVAGTAAIASFLVGGLSALVALSIPAAGKLHFDGAFAGDTFYQEAVADTLILTVGGTALATWNTLLTLNCSLDVSEGISIGASSVPDHGIAFGTSAPSALSNGQMWFDGTDFKARQGGVTKTVQLT